MRLNLLILTLFFSGLVKSQDLINSDLKRVKLDTVNNYVDSPPDAVNEKIINYKTPKEIWLSITLLGLLLVILVLEAFLISKTKFDSESAIRLIIVTIVIVGTLFLFVAGYSDKQIAPAFGLFGTICGYLFGKANTKHSEN